MHQAKATVLMRGRIETDPLLKRVCDVRRPAKLAGYTKVPPLGIMLPRSLRIVITVSFTTTANPGGGEVMMKCIFAVLIFAITFGAILIGRVKSDEVSLVGAKSAAELYSKNCASCHGKDGRAKTLKAKFNHARDLTNSAWHNEVSDERIFNSIMNGKGKKMPSYGKKLSEQDIESLVSHVRALKK